MVRSNSKTISLEPTTPSAPVDPSFAKLCQGGDFNSDLQTLWERGRRGVDGPEEGNEVLPYGWVHDEMMPHAAKGIL